MRIARELIDPDADKVVRRLARHGFQAYLVGGCVRDLLLARTPKDFDVATNATPKEIRQLFRNCRIIGRRFRLAHIFFGPKIIETSTFRANPREGDEVDETDEILIRRDNVFGTDTEDARRRDFTINGLFYDLEAERVIDHVGGLEDLERRVVRTIGDPDIRFREDPVRMLRAVKFAARLGFEIEHATLAALVRHRGEIGKCPQPRVLEELYRLLRGGAARRSLTLLIDTGLAAILSPHLTALFGTPPPLPAIEPPSPAATSALRAATAPARSAPPARKLAGDEAAWAAVWEDEEPSAQETVTPPAELEWAAEPPSADPALSHDHELEDVHDPDEEADVQAELHDLSSGLDASPVADDEYNLRPPQISAGPVDDLGVEPIGEDEGTADELDEVSADELDEVSADELDEVSADELDEVSADELDEVSADELDEDDEADDSDDADDEDEFPAIRERARRPANRDDETTGLGHGTQLFQAGHSGAVSFAPSPESMSQRRQRAWAMLDQLDVAFRRGNELSNSLLLAALCTPFVFDELLESAVRPVEANDVVLEVLHPLAQQLQVARRDAERCRQILLAQRRLAPARRRRGKPMALVRREFFNDALVIHQLMGQVAGRDVSDLSYWSKLHAQGDSGAGASAAGNQGSGHVSDELRPGKKRRRRRGGRRRRRSPGQNQGGEWEPVVGG
jgi:tRNA nucleotidyltransferase/poly(A) polymerase